MCRVDSYRDNYCYSKVYIQAVNYIMDKHNIKSKTNRRQKLEEKDINAEK
jgi:hypothetical protein